MADDLYGGSAPATPFLDKQEVFRQTKSRFSAARYVLLLEILNQLGKAL